MVQRRYQLWRRGTCPFSVRRQIRIEGPVSAIAVLNPLNVFVADRVPADYCKPTKDKIQWRENDDSRRYLAFRLMGLIIKQRWNALMYTFHDD